MFEQVAVALYITSKVGKYFSSLGLIYTREYLHHVNSHCNLRPEAGGHVGLCSCTLGSAGRLSCLQSC